MTERLLGAGWHWPKEKSTVSHVSQTSSGGARSSKVPLLTVLCVNDIAFQAFLTLRRTVESLAATLAIKLLHITHALSRRDAVSKARSKSYHNNVGTHE